MSVESSRLYEWLSRLGSAVEMALVLPLLRFRRKLLLRMVGHPQWRDRILRAVAEHPAVPPALGEHAGLVERLALGLLEHGPTRERLLNVVAGHPDIAAALGGQGAALEQLVRGLLTHGATRERLLREAVAHGASSDLMTNLLVERAGGLAGIFSSPALGERLSSDPDLLHQLWYAPPLLSAAAADDPSVGDGARMKDVENNDYTADMERLRALRPVRGLRNEVGGRRVFILGNGPSVRLDDLERLQGEVTFVANRFHLAYPSLTFRPTYTCTADLGMLHQHGETISTSCHSAFFIPYSFCKIGPPWTASRAVIPFHQEDFYRPAIRFQPNPVSGFASGASVIFTMMQLAVWMGATRMVLYGLDHEFALPEGFSSLNEEVVDAGERNHFIADYRAPGEKWWPPREELIEEAFGAAKRYCDFHGIGVVNGTRGGKLEVFDRRDLDEELSDPAYSPPPPAPAPPDSP